MTGQISQLPNKSAKNDEYGMHLWVTAVRRATLAAFKDGGRTTSFGPTRRRRGRQQSREDPADGNFHILNLQMFIIS
jgi:hypothetical protein